MQQKKNKAATRRASSEYVGLNRSDFAAIGESVVTWAAMEGLLQILIGMCCRFTFDFAVMFTSRLDIGARVELLREVLPTTPVDDRSKRELLELLGVIDALKTKRNDIVHGYWPPTEKPYPVAIKRFVKAARAGKEYQPTVRDIRLVLKEIKVAKGKLMDLCWRSEWKESERWIGDDSMDAIVDRAINQAERRPTR